MAAISTIVGIVSAVAAVAGGAASGVQQASARDDAKKAAEAQQAEQRRKLAEAQQREKDEKKIKEATLARDLAGRKLRQNQATKAGKAGTIVTSPLGVTGSAAQTGVSKTAIGE